MIIPLAAAAASVDAISLPAVELTASSNTPGGGSATGALAGTPFAVGQFVTVLAWNSGTAASTMTSPASGFTAVYNSNNGTRAANIWTIASLASDTQTITFNTTRSRTRTLGWSNTQTGLVDWDVTYGVTPLGPGALDVTGKPRSMVYSVIGGGTNTYSVPANLTDAGGNDGTTNSQHRGVTSSAVGAVSTFTVSNWTSTDNTQSAVAVSIAVE